MSDAKSRTSSKTGFVLIAALLIFNGAIEASIICGDANSDGSANVGDAVFMVNYVFKSGQPPSPLYSGDANCDGTANVGDAVYLISYVFKGGNAPCCSTFCGLLPPGMIPEKFLPEILSADRPPHGSLTFSPDGAELYWSALLGTDWTQAIFYSLFDGEAVSPPEIASFSDGPYNSCPVFSYDGAKIFFLTTRPIPGIFDDSVDAIWFVEKTESGWTEPSPIVSTADTGRYGGQLSVSRNGNIYFCARVKTEPYPRIYRVTYAEGEYGMPVKLQGQINTASDQVDPYVDPDERYILFVSSMGIGLPKVYISYRQEDSTWGTPVLLDESINTDTNIQRFPSMKRDGKFLFFIRAIGSSYPGLETDYYWIAAEILLPPE